MIIDNQLISYTKPPAPHPRVEKEDAKIHRSVSEQDKSAAEAIFDVASKVDPALASRAQIVPKISLQDNPFPTYNSRYKWNRTIQWHNQLIDLFI